MEVQEVLRWSRYWILLCRKWRKHGCGILNNGTITSLINYQTQGQYGPLYYIGNLPSIYYIGYNSSNNSFGNVQFLINSQPSNINMQIRLETYSGSSTTIGNAVVFINNTDGDILI